mgnify:CR=1 FL=1
MPENLSEYFEGFFYLKQFLDIDIVDLLDILILSVLFYWLILLVQGTRTKNILFGLSLLSFGYLGANILNFNGLNLLLNNFFNSFMVVVVVLFQADFRNALANIGRGRFFKEKENDKNIHGILFDVCGLLSKESCGALFVFEKNISLNNLYTGSIAVNAIPSVPLIQSIFDKHVPVHDGAMIFSKKYLIKDIGAILPLTVNLDMRTEYGTRHRAAIGISEETDAICIIISEQNGAISIASKGQIQKIGLSQLREFLDKNI